jgi:mannose-6-phosphate isomerase-like protein (cupin superfamily)
MMEERPWGSFTLLLDRPGCRVKTISVDEGRRLSYQSHSFREERWIVVEGIAWVTLDDRVVPIERGGIALVGRGQRHRLENRGPGRLLIVEVQLGDTLSEDDIVRYEDDFGRSGTGPEGAPQGGPGNGGG